MFLYKFLFINFIFILFFINPDFYKLILKKYNLNFNFKNNNNHINNSIINQKNLNNSFIKEDIYEAAKRAHEFVNLSSHGILINSIPLLSNNSPPKISVVIPIYNCQNTIIRAIRSIQNQNFSELEIILINDFSKDNSLNIIEELKKEDQRIKISSFMGI